MKRVENKVALITGGGAGLGKVTCELLAKEGAKIVVTDINGKDAENTANIIKASGGEALAVALDVVNEDDWEQAIAMTLDQFGALDILVNNAAICLHDNLIDTSLEDWHKVNGINLDGAFLGTRSAVKVMAENANAGSIINISSIAGLVGDNPVSYSASKGGVRMLTKSMAIECGKLGYNIRINTIFPGPMDTPMSQGLEESKAWEIGKKMFPLGRLADPIEIAKGVLFFASDDASYITGSELVIDGGITAGTGGMLLSAEMAE